VIPSLAFSGACLVAASRVMMVSFRIAPAARSRRAETMRLCVDELTN
jgi:hypothetical protein